MADELSFRVRKLDVVCSHVSEALKIVDDLLELRECSDQVACLSTCLADRPQVMNAIGSEDFEQAAKYARGAESQLLPAWPRRSRASARPRTACRRARTTPRCGRCGAPAGGTAFVAPRTEAERQLSAIVRRHFEAAMAAKDAASVSRFAKLFHPLGGN